jgi:DNA (cytosine-5)-methyltransferase 1
MPKTSLKYIDIFAGLGGFHLALERLGHRCVFACEIDEDLSQLYERNFGLKPSGDLRKIPESDIPKHDVLCAGFPCQPFSKAGEQKGTKCKLWGDLFSGHVLRIIKHHHPKFLLMENVANLERHDAGRTWNKMRRQLVAEGYSVETTVLSPHKLGVPQIRERLYIVASLDGLDDFHWPQTTELDCDISSVLDKNPPDAKQLSTQVICCLETWQRFLKAAPKSVELPSFPIWTMEFGATYPFTGINSLYDLSLKTLRNYKGCFGQKLSQSGREDIHARLPSYSRGSGLVFPK